MSFYQLTTGYKQVKPKEKSEEANPPALRKLFQDSAVAKLLDFLTLYKDFDYSKVEISRNSGVAWKTLYRAWPVLEKYGLVVETSARDLKNMLLDITKLKSLVGKPNSTAKKP